MSISLPKDERRVASRVEVNLPARYASDSLAVQAQVKNLSRHGLFLSADPADREGSKASVSIDLPSRRLSLSLSGDVVRTGETGMAIRFRPLPKDAQRELANFLIEAQCA